MTEEQDSSYLKVDFVEMRERREAEKVRQGKHNGLDKELLQDKIEVSMMALKLSLEDYYTPDKIGYVMKLIEDIWRAYAQAGENGK